MKLTCEECFELMKAKRPEICAECKWFTLGYDGATFGWCRFRNMVGVRTTTESCIDKDYMIMSKYRIIKVPAYNGCEPITAHMVQVAHSTWYGEKWTNVKGFEDRRKAIALYEQLSGRRFDYV